VILNNGLEVIGAQAFQGCTSLLHIEIPSAGRAIDKTAFKRCSDLTTVRFCNDIEEFVSGESMWHWWNNGVHEKCPSMYFFFVRFNIPEHLGLVRATQWQDIICGMLVGHSFHLP